VSATIVKVGFLLSCLPSSLLKDRYDEEVGDEEADCTFLPYQSAAKPSRFAQGAQFIQKMIRSSNWFLNFEDPANHFLFLEVVIFMS